MTTIELDETTMMMVKMLKDHLALEPALPDPDNLYEPAFREQASAHHSWYRMLAATRLMVGARLMNAMEDQLLLAHEKTMGE